MIKLVFFLSGFVIIAGAPLTARAEESNAVHDRDYRYNTETMAKDPFRPELQKVSTYVSESANAGE